MGAASVGLIKGTHFFCLHINYANQSFTNRLIFLLISQQNHKMPQHNFNGENVNHNHIPFPPGECAGPHHQRRHGVQATQRGTAQTAAAAHQRAVSEGG